LLAAVVLAIAAGALIYVSLQHAREQALTLPVEVVTPVLVARTDVAPGTVLEQANVSNLFELTRVAADQVAPEAITSLAALEGHTTAVPLHAGDRVLTSSLAALAPSTAAGPRSDLLPQGHVAIVLDVNDQISVGGAVAPTDRVDVIATVPVPSNAGPPVPVTQAILRNVRVLATGFRTRPAPTPPTQAAASAEPTPPSPYPTLTLALKPQDAVVVQHLLAQNVRLALALRRPGDEEEPTSPETTAEIARRFNLLADDQTTAGSPPRTAVPVRP
jgi:pilus assembly protein CpaB